MVLSDPTFQMRVRSVTVQYFALKVDPWLTLATQLSTLLGIFGYFVLVLFWGSDPGWEEQCVLAVCVLCMAVQSCHPSTQKAEGRGFKGSRPTLATEGRH